MPARTTEDFWLRLDAAVPQAPTREQSLAAWANEVLRNEPAAPRDQKADKPRPEPDGYLRQTPVQPIRECPGYRLRRMKQVLFWCAVGAAAVTLYLLIYSGVLRL
ncbi:MAG: hypothetical protein ACI4JC_00350 [Faecalibacterium sp.]